MKIRLEDVNLNFGKNKVLQNLNISFDSGKLSTLLGRSGSGKTSILKIIAGIQKLNSGRVFFKDRDITNLKVQDRNIGWVPQQQLIFPGLNVEDNIGYGLKARGLSREIRKSRINEVSSLVGLSDLLDRSPDGLSGGERQRVAVARALAPDPDILLLDEPFSSLDAPERDRLSLAFRNIQIETGMTTIYVTHAPREAELLSDKVFILSKGEILQSGNIKNMQKNPISVEVAKLLNIANLVEKSTVLGVSKPTIIPMEAIILSNEKTEIRSQVLSVTNTKIYLQIENNIILECENSNSMDMEPGQVMWLKIERHQYRYL